MLDMQRIETIQSIAKQKEKFENQKIDITPITASEFCSIIEDVILGMVDADIEYVRQSTGNINIIRGYEVIEAILAFIDGDYILEDSILLPEYNGRGFHQLSEELQQTIWNYPLATKEYAPLSKTEKESGEAPLSAMVGKEKGVLLLFLDYLKETKCVTDATAYNYYMTIRHFAKFLYKERFKMECTIPEVVLPTITAGFMTSTTREELVAYLDFCRDEKKETTASLKVRVSVLRNFFKWARGKYPEEEALSKEPYAEACEKKEDMPKSIDAKTEELICAQYRTKPMALRNVCILKMMLHCGLSVSDILNLTCGDIKTNAIVVIRNGKHIGIPMGEDLNSTVYEYIEHCGHISDSIAPFFPTNGPEKISRMKVHRIIKNVCEAFQITAKDLEESGIERVRQQYGVDFSQQGSVAPPEYTYITPQEETILCEAAFQDIQKERNICMIRLFVRCGLGLQELVHLKTEDISGEFITVVRGGKSRKIPIDDITQSAISNYAVVRLVPNDNENAFFVSMSNRRINRVSVEKAIRRIVKKAGYREEAISVRDLSLTGRSRLIREHGMQAMAFINITTESYFQKAYAQDLEIFRKRQAIGNT